MKRTKNQVIRNASFAAQGLCPQAAKTTGYADFDPLRTHIGHASAKPSDALATAQAVGFTGFCPEAPCG